MHALHSWVWCPADEQGMSQPAHHHPTAARSSIVTSWDLQHHAASQENQLAAPITEARPSTDLQGSLLAPAGAPRSFWPRDQGLVRG